jgi:hypothetical protein
MIEPEAPHREIRKTGHNWLDLTIAVSALLISATSLIVAIVHSHTLERMADANARLVETNSWPFLAYNTANGDAISMSIMNDGVGPAKIEALEVKWRGKARRDPYDFLEGCCGIKPGATDVEHEVIVGRVLRAGQSVDVLSLLRTPADSAAWNVLNRARISRDLSIDVCYCSVFDDCWTEDIVRFSLQPRPVDRCTQPAVPFTIRQ